jgi:hypothetical protein
VGLRLLAAYFGVSLLGWVAAAIVLVLAAPRLAAGDVLATRPVLAAHLVALAFLPAAVSGGAFHLLPVMLRNPFPRERLLVAALPLLALGAWLAAPGIAFDVPAVLWPGTALLTLGLVAVLVELGGIVWRAPRGRLLATSRIGVGLSLFHVAAALTLGAVVFGHGDASFLGVTHARWLLVHLHVAVLGWLALLILTVGRTLGPMLALAPAPPARRVPVEELLLTLGLWVLAAGIAADTTSVSFVGGALVLVAVGRFAALLLRTFRARKLDPEGPLLHLVAGAAFLVQAGVLGFALLAGVGREARGLAAYGVLLLVGWAAGVILGHLPKLLSLSIWVWWPPGPRPKQHVLYPRRLAQAEAAAFAVGVEVFAIGVYLGNGVGARVGASLVLAAAALVALTAARIWSRRSRASEQPAPHV